MTQFKGTPGPWIADIRGGCAAIYPTSCVDDTPGCHSDDYRNIAYSDKGAKFNGMRWEIDSSVEYDFKLMAAAPELLEALQCATRHLKYAIDVISEPHHVETRTILVHQTERVLLELECALMKATGETK